MLIALSFNYFTSAFKSADDVARLLRAWYFLGLVFGARR
jgi:hypothetical protein